MPEALAPTYDWFLVAVSVGVAILASYATLDLASSLTVARGRARLLWLAGGSLAMGMGIWSMHFIGMLAVHVDGLPMAYDVPLLVVSVFVAIGASVIALQAVSQPRLVASGLAFAAIAMGSGIAGMHYIGMASMRMPARFVWNVPLVSLSVAIAFAASLAALWLAFRYRGDASTRGFWARALGSVVLGGAISGMHYTAMAAVRFVPTERPWSASEEQLLATDGLAVAVGLSTLLILAVALAGSGVDRALGRRAEVAALAERRAAEEGGLRALAHELVGTARVDVMLDKVARHALQIAHASAAYVEVIAGDVVEVVATAGAGAPPAGTRVPFPGSLTQQIIRAGAPEVVPDISAEERPMVRHLRASCAGCAAMAVPLLEERRAIGAIVFLRRPDERPFGEDSKAPAAIVANLAAIAILRAEREAERQRLLERVSGILESITDAFVALDREWRFTYVNEAAARVLHRLVDRQRHELIGREVWTVLPGARGSRIEAQLRQAADGQVAAHFEIFVERSAAWFEIHAYPGDEGLSVYFREVTERKRSERSLRMLAETGAILASASDVRSSLAAVARLLVPALADWCVVDLRSGERIERVEVVHRDPGLAEVAGRYRALPPDFHDPDSPVARVLRTGQPELVPDASVGWAGVRGEKADLSLALGVGSILILPLASRGQTLGALSLIDGPSGRRFDTADLLLGVELARRCAQVVDTARLYAEAQDAITNRDEVLAIVAHDLRNPLSSVVARADLLQRQAPPDAGGETLRHGVDAILRAAQRMERLIDDLLDISLLEKGRLTLSLTSEAPADIVAEIAETFAPMAAEQRLALETEVADDLPRVRCDRARVLQVLSNFLGNALRVTPSPGVVAISAARDPAGVRFAVRDTGPGIEPEQRERIFERYHRAAAGSAYRGAGLGLAISRGIVEAHGGTIGVDSTPGRGSTFWFTLPLDHASAIRA